MENLSQPTLIQTDTIKGPRDDGSGHQLPAERHEDFIDEIERVRLAHIPVFYSIKKA